jgi:hypothetical protein
VEIWPSSVSTAILAAPVSLTNHLSLAGGRAAFTKVILRNCVNIKSKAAGFTIARNRRGVVRAEREEESQIAVEDEGSRIFVLED